MVRMESEIIKVGVVTIDLSSIGTLNFAILHWTWEIVCIWHFSRKSDHNSGNAVQHHSNFDKVRATPRDLGKIVVSYKM